MGFELPKIDKYYAAIIVIVLIIILYFVFNKYQNKSEKVTDKKKSKNKKSSKKLDNDDEDEERAKELYELVHDKFCEGLDHKEFEELAGEIAPSSVYIILAQYYSKARDDGINPKTAVKLQDYVAALKDG